jgi:hypothetical protein
MSLPARTAPGDWPAVIENIAKRYRRAIISVFNPSDVLDTRYNPLADTGGKSTMVAVIENRAARIVPISVPREFEGKQEWATKEFFHVQIELLGADPLLTKGLILRVVDGGKDATLEQYAFTVISAVNSSDAALRTIKCVSGMIPVAALP